jgi:hypothetical protein
MKSKYKFYNSLENKMKRGKIIESLILGILLIGIVSAATYCCEKTTSGAWCQSVSSQAQCNSNFQTTAAYCEATSYCKTGTCINQKEGLCTTSTESACTSNGGYWSSEAQNSLPQCKLGCCLMGNQAAFVTQTNCNRLASLYGLKINFKAGINDELTCLASANPEEEGACVYTRDYSLNCERTTRADCQDKAKLSSYQNASFHAGYLCSAQALGTICAKSKETICYKDDVYFVDTCKQLANIYDASKLEDENYWTKIQDPTCGNKAGNKDSPSCGDCDFYSGSMCKEKDKGENVNAGSYICKNLDCSTYRGVYSGSSSGYATASKYPKHGETWCATDARNQGGAFSPGATFFRMICYNGEVTHEECDSMRQQICFENVTDKETGFLTGNCGVNEWSGCWQQGTQEDCEDIENRDCSWVGLKGYSFSIESGLFRNDSNGVCVPKYAPGFERAVEKEEEDGSTVVTPCGIASSTCVVKLKEHWTSWGGWKCDSGFLGTKYDENNCSCVEDADGNYDGGKYWASKFINICTSLGDCGSKVNYIGELGSSNKYLTETKIG